MTDPIPAAGVPDRGRLAERGAGASLAIGPEAITTAIAVLLIASIALVFLVTGPAGTQPPLIPHASDAGGPTPPASTEPGVNLAYVSFALQVDARLAADRVALDRQLDLKPFDASATAAILRGANADILSGQDVARRLAASPPTADVGRTLSATYEDLHQLISDALDNSVRNGPAYEAAGKNIVAGLARLEAIDAVLRRLQEGPAPSAPASVPPSGEPVPSVPPPSEPAGGTSPSPAPSSAALTNDLVNPGFETGVGAPWELLIGTGASATLNPDRAVHAGGAASARVDISTVTDERASVAVRQGGLSIEAGSRYVATIAARADAPREVRIRIASAAGDSYGTRLYTIGPDWQVLTLDVTVFATDPAAALEIDLGRSSATTWLDDVTFGRALVTGG
ncbi:MAG TPA: hypothetical protein VFI34_08935 [Candidatus Limnocylindrales bacterium]|nr:hypothetical protein [Candidatus Limnocylindrales bacterium]